MLAEPGFCTDAREPAPTSRRHGSVLVATRLFGASGQPWLWRQVVGLQHLRCSILCWERQNQLAQPLDGIPLHLLPGDVAPYDGHGRWGLRLRNLRERNFYAAVGDDCDRIADVLRRERPDVVLCYFGDIGMRVLPSAQEAGIPIVVYLHGDFLFNSNRWYRWSFLRCLRHFAAFVVVTDVERHWLREHGVPDARIHLVPCGAPTELFLPRGPSTHEAVRFVMSSRLVAEKGCHQSVEAFSRLARELQGIELHIYGDGPARHELQRFVTARGIESRVFFYGYIDGQRLAGALSSKDIFIQHSLGKEGSPVAIVEAMAVGLPIVSTRVGGIASQVIDGETGFLVAENDVSAMVDAMGRLARSAQLRGKFGQAGRRRAVKHYDARRQTRRLERVLLDFCSLGPQMPAMKSEQVANAGRPVLSPTATAA